MVDLKEARTLAEKLREEHWQFGTNHPETKLRREAAATILALFERNERLETSLLRARQGLEFIENWPIEEGEETAANMAADASRSLSESNPGFEIRPPSNVVDLRARPLPPAPHQDK